MNENDHFFPRALDADPGDSRPRMLLLDEAAHFHVLDQQLRKLFLAGIPLALPVDHDSGAEASRPDFLTHDEPPNQHSLDYRRPQPQAPARSSCSSPALGGIERWSSLRLLLLGRLHFLGKRNDHVRHAPFDRISRAARTRHDALEHRRIIDSRFDDDQRLDVARAAIFRIAQSAPQNAFDQPGALVRQEAKQLQSFVGALAANHGREWANLSRRHIRKSMFGPIFHRYSSVTGLPPAAIETDHSTLHQPSADWSWKNFRGQ